MMREAEFGLPSGQTVEELSFSHTVDERTSLIIIKAFVSNCSLFESIPFYEIKLRSLFPGNSFSGSYKISFKERSYFVRVTPRLGNILLERSLMRSLNLTDSPVIKTHLLTVIEINNEKYRFEVRDLVDGRHPQFGNLVEVKQVALALRRLHTHFLNVEGKEKIRENFIQRVNEWRTISKNLPHYFKMDSEYFELFQREEQFFSLSRKLLNGHIFDSPRQQIVHGEPHQGNVILKDLKIYLIDLEESVRLYVPIEWDYVYLLHRFSHNLSTEEPELLKLLNRFLLNEIGLDQRTLRTYCQLIPYLIILQILSDLTKGVRAPINEVSKFLSFGKKDYRV